MGAGDGDGVVVKGGGDRWWWSLVVVVMGGGGGGSYLRWLGEWCGWLAVGDSGGGWGVGD